MGSDNKKSFHIDELLVKDKKTITDTNRRKTYLKKLGAPKKEVVRNKPITAYFTEDEYAELRKIADEQFISVSKLIAKITKEKFGI
jgi:hypothetical protein